MRYPVYRDNVLIGFTELMALGYRALSARQMPISKLRYERRRDAITCLISWLDSQGGEPVMACSVPAGLSINGKEEILDSPRVAAKRDKEIYPWRSKNKTGKS